MNSFSLSPEQEQGNVVVVFDNGDSSILPAAQVMSELGLKGNVGEIGGYTAKKSQGYLTLRELQDLQNIYGWNIINESFYHKNAVADYYDTNNLSGLDSDILKGAEYLTANGINSDPNWFIYPGGGTNEAIGTVVGKYYKFARTTSVGPEVYPFGDPLAVKTFPTIVRGTSPESVMKAIYDAKKYNLTLFLTFRRIQTSPTDRAGFSLLDFQKIMEYIVQQNIGVKTLSELDQSNGVDMNTMKLATSQPEQLSLSVAARTSIFGELSALLSGKF